MKPFIDTRKRRTLYHDKTTNISTCRIQIDKTGKFKGSLKRNKG